MLRRSSTRPPPAQILPLSIRRRLPDLKVAIDLNAVPPAGIEGLDAMNKGADRDGVRAWGAIAVGGTKMKIHKKAVQELFLGNDRILDAEQVFALGKGIA